MSSITFISSRGKSLKETMLQLYQYRDLLYVLAWRDVKVQYAQTLFGMIWALGNPLLSLFVLTFVFGTVAKADVGGVPHALYTLAGLCGWTYFATIFGQAGNSMIGAQSMIKKLYFPRLIIPLSKALVALIDFVILIFCFGVLLLWYDYPISDNIVFFPLFTLLIILAGLAGGIWISALTVRYRDFQHVSPLLVRIGMFATPIAYSASAVPEKYQFFFYLNPLAGVVEGMKWSLLGTAELSSLSWLSFGLVLVLFVLGVIYFIRTERKMADIL